MAGFLDVLRIEEVEGSDRLFRLLEDCVYYLRAPDGEEFVVAPTGMVTDFGSIPPAFWWIPGLSPFGHYRRAYVIHDKIWVAPVIRTETSARPCSFSEGNAILRDAMKVLDDNMPGGNAVTRAWRKTTRGLVWSQVATFGRISWNRYRARDREAAA